MPSASNNGVLIPMSGDVTKIDTLDNALQGSYAAIFAASAISSISSGVVLMSSLLKIIDGSK